MVPHVCLASNGRYWQARWTDAHGRRHTRSLGPKAKTTKADARRACRRIARELEDRPGRITAGQAPTLGDWIDHYTALRTDIGEESHRLIAQTADYLLEHFGPARRIDQIDRAAAAKFRAWLAHRTIPATPDKLARTITEQTVRKHIRNARTLFGDRHGALKYDLLPYNPFDRERAGVPDVDQDWRYITREELAAMLDACPSDGWRCLIGMARLAGMRQGEITRARWDDIDFEHRRIEVRPMGRVQTTKQRRRTIPIDPELFKLLLKRFESAEPGETVVGLSAVYVAGTGRKQFEKIIKAAGIEPYAKPYHTLRKNCETDWMARYPVLDVAKWLGHAPAVAQKHYHQPRPEIMDQAAGVGETEIDKLRRENAELRARLASPTHGSH